MKVVWKSVGMEYGEQCVMTSGVQQMPRLYADNLDFQTQVKINISISRGDVYSRTPHYLLYNWCLIVCHTVTKFWFEIEPCYMVMFVLWCRCTRFLICLLWPRNWSYSDGQCPVHWNRE